MKVQARMDGETRTCDLPLVSSQLQPPESTVRARLPLIKHILTSKLSPLSSVSSLPSSQLSFPVRDGIING